MRLVALSVVALAGLPALAADIADTGRTQALILEATNEFRAAQGLERVKRDPQLQAAADSFARFMARTGKYSHDADGSTAGQRARAAGYAWCEISENIAYQFDSRGFDTEALADKVLEGWKKSPGHRANILDRAAVDTAIAVTRNERTGYYYSVQMFGRRCK